MTNPYTLESMQNVLKLVQEGRASALTYIGALCACNERGLLSHDDLKPLMASAVEALTQITALASATPEVALSKRVRIRMPSASVDGLEGEIVGTHPERRRSLLVRLDTGREVLFSEHEVTHL